MTVMYTDKVANATFGGFVKLLFRWRGSMYKLIWKELVVYLAIYYAINMSYRYAMTASSRRVFEMAVSYCKTHQDAINLTFVLGFYVSVVFTRWQDQFSHIPWPDSSCIMTSAYLRGDDERGRLMRRTVIRYINLGYVMTMRSISPPVKKRFPTMDHMVAAGLLLANEQKILDDINTPYNKYPIPIIWATSVLARARKEDRIETDYGICQINFVLNEFRRELGRLFLMDCVSIPLVYTQVVTLCTYIYFAFTEISDQFIVVNQTNLPAVDLYVPIASMLKFLFYMGWLKVAEVIINPFGEDDDDFDINAYIDRNWTFSYLMVDDMHAQHPELLRDAYWDQVDSELPYTVANAAKTPEQMQFAAASVDDPKGPVVRIMSQPGNKVEYDRSNLGAFSPKFQTKHHYKTPFDNRFEETTVVGVVTRENSLQVPRKSSTTAAPKRSSLKRSSVSPSVNASEFHRTSMIPKPTENTSPTADAGNEWIQDGEKDVEAALGRDTTRHSARKKNHRNQQKMNAADG